MEESLNAFKKENPFLKIDFTDTVDRLWKGHSYIMVEINDVFCSLHLMSTNVCHCQHKYTIQKVRLERDQWVNSRVLVYYFTVEPEDNVKCVYNSDLDAETVLIYNYTDCEHKDDVDE